jgi:hypothetical protein
VGVCTVAAHSSLSTRRPQGGSNVVHTIQATIGGAVQILGMLQARSPHSLSRLTGFILVGRTLDGDGTLRTHAMSLDDQSSETTQSLLADGERLIKDR